LNNETISAIASLWPLALIIFLLIISFLFKPQIAAFLNRFAKIQIRKGDTELLIAQQENKIMKEMSPPQTLLEESRKLDISEKPSVSDIEEGLDINSLSQEDLNREMYFAFLENNVNRAEEIFKRVQSIEEDQIQRYQNESLYLYLRFSKGDTSALEKLHQLEDTTQSYTVANSFVCFYIGKCHESVSQFEAAITAFKKSASLAQEESKKANCLSSISNCYCSLGQKDIALDVLEDGIQYSSNAKALSTLYLSLADLFKRSDDNRLRAIALEKALEFQPNDPFTRFDTAFSYGDGDFKNLSLYHYKTLIGFSPEHRAGLNNLGVVYGELQMPILSVKYYKRAWKQKETLAAANLAYQYLNAGFSDEAQNILAEAKIEIDIHPNVGSALSAISRSEESEAKNEQKIIEKALEQQRFFLKFAQNYFTKVSAAVEINGSWIIDGKISNFTQTDSQITGTWGENDNRRRFLGTIKNTGAILKFEKWGYNLSQMSKSFVNDDEGYAYLSSDLQTLNVMIIRKSDYQLLTFSRQNQENKVENAINSKTVA
jgi:tetratricopeptide (TPR) repeat protein